MLRFESHVTFLRLFSALHLPSRPDDGRCKSSMRAALSWLGTHAGIHLHRACHPPTSRTTKWIVFRRQGEYAVYSHHREEIDRQCTKSTDSVIIAISINSLSSFSNCPFRSIILAQPPVTSSSAISGLGFRFSFAFTNCATFGLPRLFPRSNGRIRGI